MQLEELSYVAKDGFPSLEEELRLPDIDYLALSANDVLNIVDLSSISDSVTKELNRKFFDELDRNVEVLGNLVPKLRKVFGDDLPQKKYDNGDGKNTIGERYRGRFFTRELAVKIIAESDKIRECQGLSGAVKDKIIAVAESFMTCRAALIRLNDRLVHYYFQIDSLLSQEDKAKNDDLIQFARIGLIRAVDHFDSKRGSQFSTYAMQCIDEIVCRGPVVGGFFGYNYKTGIKAFKLKGKLNQQKNEVGYNDLDEIAEEFNWRRSTVRRLFETTMGVVFFSEYERNNGIEKLECYLETGEVDNPVFMAIASETQERKSVFLSDTLPVIMKEVLTERELEVLTMYYGLREGLEQKTYEEIAKELTNARNHKGPITRQGVQQTEKRAIRKLLAILEEEGLLSEVEDMFWGIGLKGLTCRSDVTDS